MHCVVKASVYRSVRVYSALLTNLIQIATVVFKKSAMQFQWD